LRRRIRRSGRAATGLTAFGPAKRRKAEAVLEAHPFDDEAEG
jgi:hypothetical protein